MTFANGTSAAGNVFTPDQQGWWDLLRPDLHQADGLQTRDQARNFAIFFFRHWCEADGLETPSDAAIAAALRRSDDPPNEAEIAFALMRATSATRRALWGLPKSGSLELHR